MFAALDPVRYDWFLVFVPCVTGSLILLIQSALHRFRSRASWVLVDGSNVMHWKNGKADIDTLREVLSELAGSGLKPAVVFDANAGYKLCDRYLDDRALGRLLDLPSSRVMVAPKGNPADPFILNAARDNKARIVSNDRFRDWFDDFSDVLQTGALVSGGYKHGKLWLALELGRET
ncbi:NYN domain-containing protein [Ruegeria sp. MALMAid1280]|uniref:NYN domain-containing protein n=1 Tax=Ruegeria sp. MALMAid1280 TaxID=3411634 RepID=UPI003BA2B5B5